MGEMKTDPLFHPGWIAFNEEQWNLKAHPILLGPEKGTAWELSSIIYTKENGQVVMPPRNPHLPVHFECSSAKPGSINRRMRIALTELASLYARRGLRSSVTLSPVVRDVRPFIWKGMGVEPRYTYYIDLIGYPEGIDSSVIKKARKSRNLHYFCEVTDDLDAAHSCLNGPELRKGFDHKVEKEGLKKLLEYMGNDSFAVFICRDKEHNPVGSRVTLFQPGGMALAWSAGVKTEALKDGVNNLLGEFALQYFQNRGCTVFDFVGANISPVAEMKEAWGGELVCYYTIRQRNFRSMAREVYSTMRQYLKR